MRNLIKLCIFFLILTIFASCVEKEEPVNQIIEVVEEKAEPIIEVDNNIYAFLNDSRVRLRSEPNLSSETITYLESGDKVIVLERSIHMQKIDDMNSYWYKVDTIDNFSGWVYGFFLNDLVDDYLINVSTAGYFKEAGFYIYDEGTVDQSYTFILSDGNYDIGKKMSEQSISDFLIIVFSIDSEELTTGIYKGFYEGLTLLNGKNQLDFKIRQPVEITLNDGVIELKAVGNLYKGIDITDRELKIEYKGNLTELPYVGFR